MGERRGGVGEEEPNHTTAKKPGPPLIIQYSLTVAKYKQVEKGAGKKAAVSMLGLFSYWQTDSQR